MFCNQSDLSSVYIGEGSFSKKQALTSKRVSLFELQAILYDAPETYSKNFIFQEKQLAFAFPNNRGKAWLRNIKNFLLNNSAEDGQKAFQSLYLLTKGSAQNIKGKIFVRTKHADYFSKEDLQKIAQKILKRFAILPKKFCSLDACIEFNDDVSVEPGCFLHSTAPGKGFYIHFSVSCRLKKIMRLKPLEYFNEKRFFKISEHGHYTNRRNGICYIISHLLEYGNNLTEQSESNIDHGWLGYQTPVTYQNTLTSIIKETKFH